MLFTSKENLEDRIIRYLITGEQTAEDLHQSVNKEPKKYTIQSVYTTLRNLLESEVVVKRGLSYYLNKEWQSKVISQFQSQSTLDLENGESVSYNLSSLANSDLQWKNIVLPLHQIKPKDPIFFYNYHYLWLHLSEQRKTSELEYFAELTKNKIYTFCLIGADLPQDREFKKLIQNDFVQVAIGKKIFSEREHVTLFGDYIITTSFSPTLAKEIDEAYAQSSDFTTLEPLLHRLNVEKKKIRLTIEYDHDKVRKFRKKFASEFFIPKDLVKTFDLYEG